MHKVGKSRHIEGMDYDTGSRQLRVHFKNGSSKAFHDVPKHVYEEMCSAPSAGRYFHNVIKLHYRCVNEPEDES